jgi:hypothetical protein
VGLITLNPPGGRSGWGCLISGGPGCGLVGRPETGRTGSDFVALGNHYQRREERDFAVLVLVWCRRWEARAGSWARRHRGRGRTPFSPGGPAGSPGASGRSMGIREHEAPLRWLRCSQPVCVDADGHFLRGCSFCLHFRRYTHRRTYDRCVQCARLAKFKVWQAK